MTLKDLFNENANYLDRLSAISYAELKTNEKADFDPGLQKELRQPIKISVSLRCLKTVL